MIFINSLLLSGCSTSPIQQPYNVPLSYSNQSELTTSPNKKLNVYVSDKIENPQLIGGNDSQREIIIQNIFSWLNHRLININELGCTLTNKTNIKISVKKFFVTVENKDLVGTVLLNAKITTFHHKTITQNYRGDCQSSFLYLDEKKELQSCFNDSLDMIIPDIKRDLCKANPI